MGNICHKLSLAFHQLIIRLTGFLFYLLAVLSCGIGLLWLMPYMQQTMVSFYLDVQDVKGAAHS